MATRRSFLKALTAVLTGAALGPVKLPERAGMTASAAVARMTRANHRAAVAVSRIRVGALLAVDAMGRVREATRGDFVVGIARSVTNRWDGSGPADVVVMAAGGVVRAEASE